MTSGRLAKHAYWHVDRGMRSFAIWLGEEEAFLIALLTGAIVLWLGARWLRLALEQPGQVQGQLFKLRAARAAIDTGLFLVVLAIVYRLGVALALKWPGRK